MAAPTVTARATPAGIKLDRGHSTKIAFARDSNVSFWEKEVTPPAVDGGDPIDTTTMFNTAYRTFASRALVTLPEFTVSAAYDPNVINDVITNLINQAGAITVHFPDGSTYSFFGYLKAFSPQGLSQDNADQPMAEVTIVVTNWDPANRVEAGPVLTQVAGT